MGISAKEAAALVGMSKTGIIKAIVSGKLSATKDIHGVWDIDPVELFRVYAPVSTTVHSTIEVDTKSIDTRIESLEEQLSLQRELIESQKETIEDLRATVASLRPLLLTDRERRTWWQRLTGK